MSVVKFDLQAVVEDWAREYFERKANKKESKLFAQKAVQWKVDWKNILICHEATEYEPRPPKAGQGDPVNLVLFNTSFTNKTNSKQRYTFKVERSTRSSCSVDIEKGFTKGYEMEVKLTTPMEIMEASAGFKKEMSLTKIEGQSIEEELMWGTDSEIEVDAKSTAVAKLVVKEEEYEGRFVVRTKVSGRVRVVFNNIRDNNSFIKALEGDIYEVMKQMAADKRINPEEHAIEFQDRVVTVATIGKCRFKYGVEQMAEVDQIPL